MIFLIPNVSNLVWDTKNSVKELSRIILNKLLKCNGNKVINDDIIKDAYGNEIKIVKQKERTASEKKN